MCDISTGQQACHFSIEIRLVDGCTVVALAGEIDLVAAPAVREAAIAAATEHGHVVVDASEVTFLDCAGLEALMSVAGVGAALVVRSPSQSVLWLCELAGLLPDGAASCATWDELRLA